MFAKHICHTERLVAFYTHQLRKETPKEMVIDTKR